jgi:hypothetical protein
MQAGGGALADEHVMAVKGGAAMPRDPMSLSAI